MDRRGLDALAAESFDDAPVVGETENHDPDLFPADRAQAMAWLEHIRPFARELVFATLDDVPPHLAATALRGDLDPDARARLHALLAQSFGEPTPSRIELRRAASLAISAPLPAELAEELAHATVAWADTIADPTCRYDDPAIPIRNAVHAAYAALERASTDPAPLRRVREHLHPGTSVRSTCEPGREDGARAAALRYLVELRFGVDEASAPGARCVEVADRRGRIIPIVAGAWLTIHAPIDVTGDPAYAVGDPAWDEAPTYEVSIELGGPSQGERGGAIVRLVGDEWRVIATIGVSSWVT